MYLISYYSKFIHIQKHITKLDIKVNFFTWSEYILNKCNCDYTCYIKIFSKVMEFQDIPQGIKQFRVSS